MMYRTILAGALTLAFAVWPSLSNAAAAAACTDPQGYQWAIYPNTAGPDPSKPANYPAFDPTVIKTETPEFSGVASSIGLIGGLYSDPQYYYFDAYSTGDYVNDVNFTIDHRGYIKAPVSGFYNFTIVADDDIVEFWVGENAYSGFTRGNSKITYSTSKKPHPPISISFRVVKGYTPIRIIFAQATSAYDLGIELYDPSGNNILGSGTPYSPAIVQYGCNPKSKAPPFPPYGSET